MAKMKSGPDRLAGLMSDVSSFHASEFLLDTVFITKDGKVWAHSLMLGAVSPFIKSLCDTVDGSLDEPYTIFVPDVAAEDLHILFHLLYTGCAYIYKSELDTVKALTGLLKIISISVTMSRQDWKTRKKIGDMVKKPNIKTDTVIPSDENSSSYETLAKSSFLNVHVSDSKNKSSQIEKGPLLGNPSLRSQNLTTSDIQLMRFANSDLDKLTMSELASKELNPLFEESSTVNMTKFPSTFTENVLHDSTQNIEPNRDVADMVSGDSMITEGQNLEESLSPEMMEDLESVKEIQVYVSGSGEVTAMEVLRGEDETLEASMEKSLINASSTLNRNDKQQAEKESESKDEFMGAEADREEIDFDIHHITSMNSDAPFVISSIEGSDGVIGLISVTEAFENSQKPDFNDVSNSVVEGTETESLIRSCVLCDKSVLGLHALGRHMKKAHPKLFGPYDCPFPHCKRTQEDGTKMLSHVTQQHSKPSQGIANKSTAENKCKICNIMLSSREILSSHCSRLHGIEADDPHQLEKQVFLCNISSCNQKFRTCRSYAQHMKQEHNEKPWQCDECDKKFEVKQNYQQHTLLHGQKKCYVCDLCSKSYATPRLLYSHRSLHLGRRFPCDICGFVGRSSANIRGHKINVHGERKFSCSVCGKKFAVASNLQDHMRIHTGETPYTCEICDMSYKRKHHLTCHFRSKGHMDMLTNCNKLGIKVPPDLDPDHPKPVPNRRVQETILPSHTNFETHIAEIDEDDQQVLVFEPCEEMEPYIIEESEEVVVM